MNPQNQGPHITFQHSHLWRKPQTYQKPQPKQQNSNIYKICHTAINEDIKIKKNRLLGLKQPKQFIRTSLNKSTKNISSDIKQTKNWEGPYPLLALYPGVGQVKSIINDYHPWISRPNYSRNQKGKHFTS